jgi:hypothetical protein
VFSYFSKGNVVAGHDSSPLKSQLLGKLRSGGSQFKVSLGKKLARLYLNNNNNKLGMVVHI